MLCVLCYDSLNQAAKGIEMQHYAITTTQLMDASAQLADRYPQYVGYHDGWVLGMASKRIATKAGVYALVGDRLFWRERAGEPGWVEVFSARNSFHAVVPRDSVRRDGGW